MLGDWFGRFITRYRNAQSPAPLDKPLDAGTLAEKLGAGAQLLRHPWSRMAWRRHAAAVTLYANGQAYPATAALAQQLCAERAPTLTGKLAGNRAGGLRQGSSRQDNLLQDNLLQNNVEQALLLALVNDGHLLLHKPRRR